MLSRAPRMEAALIAFHLIGWHVPKIASRHNLRAASESFHQRIGLDLSRAELRDVVLHILFVMVAMFFSSR